jgi:hypothetical protein
VLVRTGPTAFHNVVVDDSAWINNLTLTNDYCNNNNNNNNNNNSSTSSRVKKLGTENHAVSVRRESFNNRTWQYFLYLDFQPIDTLGDYTKGPGGVRRDKPSLLRNFSIRHTERAPPTSGASVRDDILLQPRSTL